MSRVERDRFLWGVITRRKRAKKSLSLNWQRLHFKNVICLRLFIRKLLEKSALFSLVLKVKLHGVKTEFAKEEKLCLCKAWIQI